MVSLSFYDIFRILKTRSLIFSKEKMRVIANARIRTRLPALAGVEEEEVPKVPAAAPVVTVAAKAGTLALSDLDPDRDSINLTLAKIQ